MNPQRQQKHQFVFELLMIQMIKSTFQVTEKDRTNCK